MYKALKIAYYIYHGVFPSRVRVCRFDPTCSEYLLIATKKYGPLKGVFMALIRVIACNPLSNRAQFDPLA